MGICKQAIERFLDQSLKCDYKNPATGKRCKNTRLAHKKGHQTGSEDDLGGSFINKSFDSTKFLSEVQEKITSFVRQIRQEKRQHRLNFALHQHKENLQSAPDPTFWTMINPKSKVKVTSTNVPCFACLFRRPEYELPCGHFLCQECVGLFDESSDADKYPCISALSNCLFCPKECNGDRNNKIQTTPEFSGVRILSLDGGGVRGIVELKILERLEGEIGLDIPIGEFFDLIVGTSAGKIEIQFVSNFPRRS
jgi:hypothetical protein